MTHPVPLAEIWRGGIVESSHAGHVVICDGSGDIVQAWGNPEQVIFPRSSCKMLQALPLIESGAADRFGLTVDQLALSCASHQGAYIHTDRVTRWLGDLGLGEADLRCGAQAPADKEAKRDLIKSDQSPCQIHNNCSGKHCGFLTLNSHLGGGADYHLIDHPVQIAAKAAFEEVTGATSPTWGVDGCSAPNFATTVHGLARAMAFFATAHDRSDTRSTAAARLVDAMRAFPELVAGETRACTELMRATNGRVALKTGAEACFVAIIPEKRLGVALKISDGATRASECAITAILVKLGVLDADHPAAKSRLDAPMRNWNGIAAAEIRATDALR